MTSNERGGRKETTGLWAWKLETIEPGERAEIKYSLDGLEKGDWGETEVFYRGAGDVIGASKLDEKILEEIRKQEEEEILAPNHDEETEIKETLQADQDDDSSKTVEVDEIGAEVMSKTADLFKQKTLFSEEEE